MPRKKSARRFEPQFGVTKPMLDAEAPYVAKEVQSYVRQAVNELREMLRKRIDIRNHAEENLRQKIDGLPEHVRLAVQCLIVRDAYHLLELYVTYVQAAFSNAPAAVKPAAIASKEAAPLTFSESLFEMR